MKLSHAYMHVIDILDLQVCDLCLMHVSNGTCKPQLWQCLLNVHHLLINLLSPILV